MILASLTSLVATFGSMSNLTRIATTTHSAHAPKSLSERATLEATLLDCFRKTLLICSTLFAFSIYCFIAPGANLQWWIVAAWTIEYVGVMFAAILPAKGKTFTAHVISAQIMGVGMLLLPFIFWNNYSGVGSNIELILGVLMIMFALGTYFDKKRFILHELAFIYISHFSIILAAILTTQDL